MGEILPLPRGRAGWGRGSGEGSPVPGGSRAARASRVAQGSRAVLGSQVGLGNRAAGREKDPGLLPDLNPLKQGLEGPLDLGKGLGGSGELERVDPPALCGVDGEVHVALPLVEDLGLDPEGRPPPMERPERGWRCTRKPWAWSWASSWARRWRFCRWKAWRSPWKG